MENLGDGSYQIRPLVNHAQISSVNTILTRDIDHDGFLDLVLAGNLFGSEAETPRNDASIGLFLKGDGRGNFSPVPAFESGLYMGGDVKEALPIKLGEKGINGPISARNSGHVQLHRIN